MLHRKIPYRDFWYDKPPLSGLYYLIIGAHFGWPLRILDAVYVLIACYIAFRLARAWWGEAEAWTAAMLLSFFMTFYLPSAVIPFAADALMIVPHLAAIYCAYRKLPLSAGLWAGVAFLAVDQDDRRRDARVEPFVVDLLRMRCSRAEDPQGDDSSHGTHLPMTSPISARS